MAIKVKLCGFTTKSEVDFAVSLGTDFVGFVFCDSSIRNISPVKAAEISKDINNKTNKVAVVVDADDNKLSKIIDHLKPDFLQLHGHESLARVLEIKNKFSAKIIKSFGISTINDLDLAKDYQEICDLFLFDTKTNIHGGSGRSFDWNILQNYKSPKKWFLSGGLNISNIAQALDLTGARMIDISSGIEEKRGLKSKQMIEALLRKIRSYEEFRINDIHLKNS